MKLGNYLTDYFSIKFGVKQGCKMSSTLFSIYINDLAEEMRELNWEVNLDDTNTNISILLYADDIALIAPNEENLQTMLDCVNSWCLKWRMSLNENKT